MPTVLVVDDTAVDRRLAGGLLEKGPGLEVAYAEDGEQALAMIESDPPLLVVTDLQMPGVDGLELVTAINDRHPEIPVVLMTAHGSEAIAAQALARGAASYVPKAELSTSLLETVLHILTMSESDERYRKLIQCSTKNEFEFLLDNDLAHIEPLIDLVQQLISSMGLFDNTQRVRVGVALEHALLNAIYRGNLEIDSRDTPAIDQQLMRNRLAQSPYKDRRVYVNIQITRGAAQFVIRDEGPGFDLKNVPESGDPDAFREGVGRGLVLMKTFMDEVVFNDNGNEVTMTKRRDAAE